MKRQTRTLFLLLGLLMAQPACSGLPDSYSAEAIEARVVDADTKKPLEGVVVTANWQLFYSTVGGRVHGGQLMVMEAMTDKDGKFSFPAWGPKKVPKYKPQEGDVWIAHIPFLVPDSYLDNRDPQLLLFKPGYAYQGLQNETLSTTDHSPMRRSMWNDKTIELKPFKGSLEEYAKHLSFLMTDLRFIEDDCRWKQTPRMILALQKQSDMFKASGISRTLYSVDYLPTNETQCGSPKDFFRSFRP